MKWLLLKPSSKKGLITCLFLGALLSNSYAQDSESLADEFAGDIPIDIDGSFHRKSEADKLSEFRKKLERQNEDMVQKKIEDMRYQNERKMTDQLKTALSGQLNVPSNEVANELPKEEVTNEKESSEKIIIVPTLGISNLTSDNLDLESNINFGVSLETLVLKNLAVGIGVGYKTVTMDDYSPYYSMGPSSYYSGFYGMGSNNYGNSRTVEMSQWNLDVNSKLYFGKSERLRPYVGLGMSFSRFNLSYDDNTAYTWSAYNTGDEVTSGSYLSGMAMAGTDVNISETFGLKLELNYSKGFTGIMGESTNSYVYNPDQDKLMNLGEEVADSHSFGINAGMLIKF